MTNRNRIENALVTGVIALPVLTETARAQNVWLNAQPSYNLKSEQGQLRLEGGATLSDKVSLYGFIDLYPNRGEKLDFENSYQLLRLSYSLDGLNKDLEGLNAAAEYEGGTGFEDLLRLGVTYNTSLGEGNFTSLRAFPFETSGDSGTKLGIFSTQEIGKDISLQVLANYFPESNSLYLEPEIDFKINDKMNFFIQGRYFGNLSGDLISDMAPVIGIKYSF